MKQAQELYSYLYLYLFLKINNCIADCLEIFALQKRFTEVDEDTVVSVSVSMHAQSGDELLLRTITLEQVCARKKSLPPPSFSSQCVYAH